jgi:hypothetical protein
VLLGLACIARVSSRAVAFFQPNMEALPVVLPAAAVAEHCVTLNWDDNAEHMLVTNCVHTLIIEKIRMPHLLLTAERSAGCADTRSCCS